MKISVGSKSPVKVAAVRNVVAKIWPEAEVIGTIASSGVKEQPTSNEEGIEGAKNRAQSSLKEVDADIGIGIEACVYDSHFGMFLTGWVVAVDKSGEVGIGNGGMLPLPEKIACKIRKGEELGPVMDEVIGEKDTKQKQGAVGILTNNLISRTEGYEKAIIFAVARFINLHYQ